MELQNRRNYRGILHRSQHLISRRFLAGAAALVYSPAIPDAAGAMNGIPASHVFRIREEASSGPRPFPENGRASAGCPVPWPGSGVQDPFPSPPPGIPPTAADARKAFPAGAVRPPGISPAQFRAFRTFFFRLFHLSPPFSPPFRPPRLPGRRRPRLRRSSGFRSPAPRNRASCKVPASPEGAFPELFPNGFPSFS